MHEQEHMSQDARRKRAGQQAAARRQDRRDRDTAREAAQAASGTGPATSPYTERMQGRVDREREATPNRDRRDAKAAGADAVRIANTELGQHPL
ncbi:hypothetical protein [Nocardia mexicana]|uniref:Uncharacterized protein n=1 Tax=Nocardia mexicana TaxID=279262 RepID=A0A370H8B6_9NOCA|nr:hypothetical protein [Nocardia mexicana]RDI51999.1 hypothetical protein DFR68_104487 [Nocardia mexicana]